MNFAHPTLCQRLYELTGKPAFWAWDLRGPQPRLIRSNGVYGDGIWPAYLLRELWDMNPRATTWFKKETPRLGGTCSARADLLPHFVAHQETPENVAALLQVEIEQRKAAR